MNTDANLNNLEFRQSPLSAISHFFLSIGVFFLLIYLGNVAIEWILGQVFPSSLAEIRKKLESVDLLDVKEQISLYLFQFFSATISFIGAAYLVTKMMKADTATYLRIAESPNIRAMALAIGVVLVILPISSALVQYNQTFSFSIFGELEDDLMLLEKLNQNMIGALLHNSGGWVPIVALITMALVPAVAEEFFFRGLLMNQFYGMFRNGHLAVFTTAFIFTLLHFQFHQFLGMFLLAVLLGYLVYWSGSLWPSIAAHFVNNALFIVYHFYGPKDDTGFLSDDYQFSIATLIFSGVLVIGMMYLYQKQKSKRLSNHYE